MKLTFFALCGCLDLSLLGCLPYAVGTPAHPLPADKADYSLSVTALPNAAEDIHDGVPMMFDASFRVGTSAYADATLRIVNLSGLTLTYKHALLPVGSRLTPQVSLMASGGVLNLGQNLFLGSTILFSPPLRRHLSFYGGFRVLQVFPLENSETDPMPTLGAFAGVELGSQFRLLPEVGFYFDRTLPGELVEDWLAVFSRTLRTPRSHAPMPSSPTPRRP